MVDAWAMMIFGAVALAITLAIISILRLVQRFKAKKYVSVGAFALRFILSCFFVVIFGRLAVSQF